MTVHNRSVALGLLCCLVASVPVQAQSDRDTRIDNLKTFTETDRLSKERKKVEAEKDKKGTLTTPSANSTKKPQDK
jgi:hypothetical protein